MNRILNILLGVGILSYVIVWHSCVQNWFANQKEIYAISSAAVALTFSLKHFLSSDVGRKNHLLLFITITYLTFTSLAKYKMEGLTIFPIAILAGTLLLIIFELYDWLKGKPKNQKMNLIQLLCLIFFFVMLVFKIQHYQGAAIPMILFHFSLIGVAIDLIKRDI